MAKEKKSIELRRALRTARRIGPGASGMLDENLYLLGAHALLGLDLVRHGKAHALLNQVLQEARGLTADERALVGNEILAQLGWSAADLYENGATP